MVDTLIALLEQRTHGGHMVGTFDRQDSASAPTHHPHNPCPYNPKNHTSKKFEFLSPKLPLKMSAM